MSELTIDAIIKSYQSMSAEEISNLTPSEICSHLTILSSRLWLIGSEILKYETKEAKKWVELRASSKTDKETEMLMKTTEEYANSKKARYCEKVVLELIRSLKKCLQAKSDEYKNAY